MRDRGHYDDVMPDEVRWGYTMHDLDELASRVVFRYRHRWPGTDWQDLREVTWEGISESLCSAKSAPSMLDLLDAGRDTLHREMQARARERGVALNASHNGANFQRYWSWHAAPGPPLETEVAERVTVAQIIVTLPETQRRALTALAETGDYMLAAKVLCVHPATLGRWLRDARERFGALWHEGETPPQRRGHDMRAWRRETSDLAELELRARKAAKCRKKRAATAAQCACGCGEMTRGGKWKPGHIGKMKNLRTGRRRDNSSRPTLDEIRMWPAMVSASRAAIALGISPSYARELMQHGRFPAMTVRADGRYAVVTEDLIRLLGPASAA